MNFILLIILITPSGVTTESIPFGSAESCNDSKESIIRELNSTESTMKTRTKIIKCLTDEGKQ